MADERSGGRERKGRRRYFRTKKNTKEAPGQPQAPQPVKPAEPRGSQGAQGSQGRNRKTRRRARSRQRFGEEQKLLVASEPDVAYVPPVDSFIYTYAVHPEMRDAYEFRPEHFSRVGRTLADYQIDLTKLFSGNTDSLPLLATPLNAHGFDWSDWEEETNEKTAKGENRGA